MWVAHDRFNEPLGQKFPYYCLFIIFDRQTKVLEVEKKDLIHLPSLYLSVSFFLLGFFIDFFISTSSLNLHWEIDKWKRHKCIGFITHIKIYTFESIDNEAIMERFWKLVNETVMFHVCILMRGKFSTWLSPEVGILPEWFMSPTLIMIYTEFA